MRVQTRLPGSPTGDTGHPGLGAPRGTPRSPHPAPRDACPPPAAAPLSLNQPSRARPAPRSPPIVPAPTPWLRAASALAARSPGSKGGSDRAHGPRDSAAAHSAPCRPRRAPRSARPASGVSELRPEGGEAARAARRAGRCRRACGEDTGPWKPNGAPQDGPVCKPPGGRKLWSRASERTETAATCLQGRCAPHAAGLASGVCGRTDGRDTPARPGALVWLPLGRARGLAPPWPRCWAWRACLGSATAGYCCRVDSNC